MEEDIEIWKFIEGSDNKYKISSFGRVWNTIKDKECNHQIHKYGYHNCSVIYLGKRRSMGIHRLVGLHFIPNPLNKPTINHKDAIKSNNYLSNLEWATHKEQSKHISDNRLHTKAKWCCLLNSDKEIIRVSPSINEMSRYVGLKYWNVRNMCDGNTGIVKDIICRFYDDESKKYVKTKYDLGEVKTKGYYNKLIYCGFNDKTYKSQMECANDLGIAQSAVSMALLGKAKKNKYNIKYLDLIN